MKKLLFTILLGFSLSAHAGIALVQHASTRCATATTCSVTLSGVASGDSIVIFLGGSAIDLTGAPTDTNGTVNTARRLFATSVSAALYYVQSTATGTHTITATGTTSVNMEIFAAEYSGMPTSGALDVASVVASGGSFPPAGASITPAGNNELLVGFLVVAGSSVTFSSWGSSLSQVDTQAGGPSAAWASVVQSSGTSGSATATPSGSNANWVAVAAFFNAAGACTNNGWEPSAGNWAIPNGSSGSFSLESGATGSPDCSTKAYCNKIGGCAVN